MQLQKSSIFVNELYMIKLHLLANLPHYFMLFSVINQSEHQNHHGKIVRIFHKAKLFYTAFCTFFNYFSLKGNGN